MGSGDIENQKTPLMASSETTTMEAKTVNDVLQQDDDQHLRTLIQDWGTSAIFQPKGATHESTSLHEAVARNAVKCLTVLLETKTSAPNEVLDAPNADGEAPLMVAVKAGNVAAVKLLVAAGAHLNARNNNGHSVLHSLVYVLAKASDDDAFQSIADLLLARPDIDLEAHNNSRYTPLYAGAKHLPSTTGVNRSGSLLTYCRKLVAAGASLDAEDRGISAREIFQEKQALVGIVMGEIKNSPPRPPASQFLDLLVLMRPVSDIKNYLNIIPKDEVKSVVNSRLGSKYVLFKAVDMTNEELVKTFLDSGADPWRLETTGELPLHRALAKGHVGTLDAVLNAIKRKNGGKSIDLEQFSFSLLQKVLESSRNATGNDKSINHHACFQRLLQPDIILNVNQSKESNTALHLAASFNQQEYMADLLSHGAYLGAHRFVLGKDQGTILKVVSPTTLMNAMDECIRATTITDDVLNENYSLALDYRFLLPPKIEDDKTEPEQLNEMETLLEISKSRRLRQIIKHPLIETFLYAKWRKALPLYLLNVILYLIFVVLLTAFVYSLKDLRILEAKKSSSNATVVSGDSLQQDIDYYTNLVKTLMGFLIPATIYILVREIFQLVFSFQTYYKNLENLLEWFLIIVVVILCTSHLDVDSTKHLAAWGMIVAWYEFVLIMGRAPTLALYVTMLRHVSVNFLKLIFLYGAWILAFAISFNIILQTNTTNGEDPNPFDDFWYTLPKSIVMATGEFDYTDLHSHFNKKMALMASTVLVFMVFLFLIFLVLMNVMNGLAVTDTQEVREDAVLHSLTSRLELVYLIESIRLQCVALKPLVSMMHLISGAANQPTLRVKLNWPKPSERIIYGANDERFCKLNNYTAAVLRTHRLQYLEKKEQLLRGDPLAQCLSLLQELREIADAHPEKLTQVLK